MEPRLYHVSEQPGIAVFEPRPSHSPSAGLDGSAVWAVDEEHLHNYLLPRDCPRVTFHAGPDSTPEDVRRFLLPGGARRVVAVEWGWLQAILEARLSCYELDAAGFTLHDATAGYYVGRHVVLPVREFVVEDVLEEMRRRSVEVRFLPSLWGLREEAIRSNLPFSIIRMKNAVPPPEGMAAYHPLP
jgi:hypothetical protein